MNRIANHRFNNIANNIIVNNSIIIIIIVVVVIIIIFRVMEREFLVIKYSLRLGSMVLMDKFCCKE